MVENIVLYLIEFLKIFVAVLLFDVNIKLGKGFAASFVASSVVVSILHLFIDLTEYSIVYGIISILVIAAFLFEKKKIGILMFLYICIGLTDTFIGSAGMFLFNIRTDEIANDFLIMLTLNSVSLLLLIILYFIRRRTRTDSMYDISDRYVPLFLLGGLALAFYITSIQISCFDGGTRSVKDLTAFVLSISSIIFIVICTKLLRKHNENEHLKSEASIVSEMLKMQNEYYTNLLKKELETKHFRHDINNHLYCMRILLNDKKYDELERYFSEVSASLPLHKSSCETGNTIVNIIASDLIEKYKTVSFEWNGIIPEDINVSSVNLCTVFSNLLKNAFENAESTSQKRVWVEVKYLETSLMVAISNDTSTELLVKNGDIISSKKETGHGYGLKNVNTCMNNLGGTFEFNAIDGIFRAELLFTNVLTV